MSYDSSNPESWTSYDRVATASADMRELLSMYGLREQLVPIVGPENVRRMFEYLDCIDLNLKKMGKLGLGWASIAMDRALEGREGGAGTGRDVAFQQSMDHALEQNNINEAWNIAERWAKEY